MVFLTGGVWWQSCKWSSKISSSTPSHSFTILVGQKDIFLIRSSKVLLYCSCTHFMHGDPGDCDLTILDPHYACYICVRIQFQVSEQ